MRVNLFALATTLVASPAMAQQSSDPFPEPIEPADGVVIVGLSDFATLPDVAGEAPRPMLMVEEPGSGRFFVNDMRGPLYTVGPDGAVTTYLDIDDPRWGIPVEASGRERGFQSFALHPHFTDEGRPGYGTFYTWGDTEDTAPEADFVPGGGQDSHDTVLLEWTARDPAAATYDGGPPRALLRIEQPFGNHNAGHLAFNPMAAPADPDFGMLYVGVADGGSGGDPMNLAQDPSSIFGKILRIDPLGTNSANGRYGIPSDNPHVAARDALGEIYASGLRNPQRFGWDTSTGAMYVADIGQNIVEELSPVTAGANLGWNRWEGSFRFVSRQAVDLNDPRGDASMTYPVAEYGHADPLLQRQSAVTGVVAYRHDAIPQLADLLLFGDLPSGEVFYVSADDVPEGGQESIRRVLFRSGSGPRTFLEIVGDASVAQGRERATRTDLRFAAGSAGRIFLLNKHDGVVREVVP